MRDGTGGHAVVARLSGPDGSAIVECACGRGFTSDLGHPVEQQRRHARQEVAQTAQDPAPAETGELQHLAGERHHNGDRPRARRARHTPTRPHT